MEIELHQLDQKHAELRICDPGRQRRLLASLCEHGQQSAVWVVPSATAGRFVLIDGYQRVAALVQLGRDTVEGIALCVSEVEGLILSHRLATASPRCALEEGWLLETLHTQFEIREGELADRLGRSRSWVSRRLALVRVLPASVQQSVRKGKIPAQAAMKSLVPLARANAAECERLGTAISPARLSVREIARLVAAWRSAEPEQRVRICDHPLLFLRAQDERAQPEPEPCDSARASEALLKDIDVLGALCRRLRRHWPAWIASQPEVEVLRCVHSAWRETSLAFESLGKTLEEPPDAR